MKHWFSHHQLKKQLKASRWVLDPSYKARTKEALFQKALADHERFHVSVLKLNFKNMKRYSFAYFTFLILIGIGFYNFFPNGSLSAEQLIANASSNYEQSETSDGSIYYEKRETTDYGIPNDAMYSTPIVTTEEVWSNGMGDVLQMVNRDGDVGGSMIKLNEVGVPIDYEWPAPESISKEAESMANSIKKGAIYCANISIDDETRKEVLLQVSKDNSAFWFISAGSGSVKNDGYGIVETHGVSNIQTLLANILIDLNESKNTSKQNRYSIESRNEEGIKKYVLSELNAEDQRTDYIFSADHYTLERQEYYVDDILLGKTVYLEHTNFPAEDHDTIFDANAHGLVENPSFTTLIPEYIQESGCYDNHTKLSTEEQENFLASLPPEVRTGYESTIDSSENDKPYPDIENDILLPTANLIAPVQGRITQFFLEGHQGIDITKNNPEDEAPEIMSVADGKVIDVGTGWSEGYGNNVTIDHGNGFVSRYAHLHEFFVNVGDTVTQGDVIGIMGNTGRVYGNDGTHLHFELIFNGTKINPADYISF